MKILVVLAFALSALTACQDVFKQNPYGGQPPSDGAPPKVDDKPKEPQPGADSLQIPAKMTFNEGSPGEYIVKVSVKGKGNAVLTFSGLPGGVQYDQAAQRLKWTPDYKAANDPSNPNVISKEYDVEVILTSDENPGIIRLKENVVLRVDDTPMPANLLSPLDARGREGQILVHEIKWQDQEFPTGPFEAAIAGLPQDVFVEWPDKKVPAFKLKWNPQYDKIVNKTFEDFVGHVQIFNPRGKRLDFNVRWSINNQYVAPTVGGPTSIIQRGDIDFVVMSEDINNEQAPTWSFKVALPYGLSSITNTPVPGAPRPQTTGIISWKAIPPDKLGIPVNVELQACVQWSYCKTHKVTVIPQAMIMQGATP